MLTTREAPTHHHGIHQMGSGLRLTTLRAAEGRSSSDFVFVVVAQKVGGDFGQAPGPQNLQFPSSAPSEMAWVSHFGSAHETLGELSSLHGP